MNTLNLFLKNAGGEHVEAVHQRILCWLFSSPIIIKELFDVDIQNPVVTMEAHGKLFDLQIKDEKKEKKDKEKKAISIELKMWSTLKKNQINRQIAGASDSKLVYILFGISYLEKKDFLEAKGLKVIGADDLSKLLIQLSDKANSINQKLNCSAQDLRNFLIEYATRLSIVNQWFLNEAYKPEWEKKNKVAHYGSLFQKIKEGLSKQEDSPYECFLLKSDHSSFRLEITTPDVRVKDNQKNNFNREIEVEGITGKLIFWLKDNALQIFFFRDKIPVEKQNIIFAKKIRDAFVNFPSIKASGSGLKSFPTELMLMSISYTEREPEKLIELINKWYPIYVQAYKKFTLIK